MHPPSLCDIDAARIAIIKPSALGDVVQALEILPVLRKRFPRADIAWVINSEFQSLLAEHPQVSEVFPFERRGGVMGFLKLLKQLQRRRFDLALDLQGLFRTGLMTLATGAPMRIGLETSREGAGWTCHTLIPGTGRDVPAHERLRPLARALGCHDVPIESGLYLAPAARNWAAERLAALPRPVLAIHAGAGWPTKRWPRDRFAAVARRFEGSVVTVGTAKESEDAVAIVDAVTSIGRPGLCLAGQTDLQQLAALLSAADVVLSNDSGPMHLAAAAGTPVVGIFTCTSPVLSGPRGTQHELIATGVSCAASYCRRCPRRGARHLACFDDISVEGVAQAVTRVIQRRTARPIPA